jgi:uncharacterized protein YjbI with pentapeptide repeats
MANQGRLAILQHGVASWNAWRSEHPTIRPDLSRCSLVGADLTRIDLSHATLSEARLDAAILDWATLEGATYTEEQLRRISSRIQISV